MSASTASFSLKKYSLIVVCLAFIMAACGGGGSSTTPDTTAPSTTVAPAVSGTSDTATTLSVTINENGTGYYLVLPAASTPPTVTQVKVGTSFALTANMEASTTISGLIFNTAYVVYFVAQDTSNNVQAVVQSVAVSTLLTYGYVLQGGLTWMPVTFTRNWPITDAYCTITNINGLTGWRLPTLAEGNNLYASGIDLSGQGWTLYITWSSDSSSVGSHDAFDLRNGVNGPLPDSSVYSVSCVR